MIFSSLPLCKNLFLQTPSGQASASSKGQLRQTSHPQTLNVSHASSNRAKKPNPTSRSRPTLTPPTTNCQLETIQVYLAIERLTQQELLQSGQEITFEKAHFRDCNRQAMEALREYAKEFESQKTWNALSNVAHYVGFLTTSLAGLACLTGGIGFGAGICLIAAGGLGLINRAVLDTGGWNRIVQYFVASEELQKKVTSQIEITLPYILITLSLIGTVGALKTGAFALSEELLGSSLIKRIITKATATFVLGNTALGIALQLVNSFRQRRIKHIESEMRMFQTNSSEAHFKVKQNTEFSHELLALFQTIQKTVKTILSQLENL